MGTFIRDLRYALRRFWAARLHRNYFSTIGVNAFTGRVFGPADDTPAATPVVVLSYHVGQGTYGGDPDIVGATLLSAQLYGVSFWEPTAVAVATASLAAAAFIASIMPAARAATIEPTNALRAE